VYLSNFLKNILTGNEALNHKHQKPNNEKNFNNQNSINLYVALKRQLSMLSNLYQAGLLHVL
jgi:hypothetical protein